MKVLHVAYQCTLTGAIFEKETDALRCEVNEAAGIVRQAEQDDLIEAAISGDLDDALLARCLKILRESGDQLRWRLAGEKRLREADMAIKTTGQVGTLTIGGGSSHEALIGAGTAYSGPTGPQPGADAPEPLPEDIQF